VEIDALSSKTIAYRPGISPIYDIEIVNNNNLKKAIASISYDRVSGKLTIVMGEAGA
jgi:hypothetical protein